jgi:hypothetical protein
MFAASMTRVSGASPEEANEAIREKIDQNVTHYASTDPRQIGERLEELDQEWDVERTLQANAGTIALVGTALGVFVDRKFLVLPALVGGFLLQHSLQGWCPPLPIFRSLGLRTQQEIAQERYALKAVRGDFRTAYDANNPNGGGRAHEALKAVRR